MKQLIFTLPNKEYRIRVNQESMQNTLFLDGDKEEKGRFC